MSSNINDYIKPTDYGANRKDINRILSLIHDLVAQEPEAEGLQQRIMLTPHVKIRTSSVNFGTPSLLDSDPRVREAFLWKRKKPESVFTYNYIHTTTGSGLSFPVSDTWYGARCNNDGTTWIKINNHSDFNITDEVSLCLMAILPASAGGYTIFEKTNQYRLRVIDTNILEWSIYSSGAYKTAITYTFTPGVKLNIVATYKSSGSGQKLYINGALNSSDAETGVIGTSSNDIGIMSSSTGTNIVKSGFSIAYLGLLHKEVSSTWVTNYYSNKLYDTSDGNLEITTINFLGDESVTPDAEAGMFKSA